jgi:hypothetical protein
LGLAIFVGHCLGNVQATGKRIRISHGRARVR